MSGKQRPIGRVLDQSVLEGVNRLLASRFFAKQVQPQQMMNCLSYSRKVIARHGLQELPAECAPEDGGAGDQVPPFRL